MSKKVIIEYQVKDNGALEKTRVLNKEVAGTEEAGKKAAKGFATAAKAAALLGTTLAAAGIARFMKDAVRAAAEQQQTFTALSASLKNVGVNYNDVGKDLQAMLGQLQKTTRYGDTDTAAALQRLVAITGDYDAALKLLSPTLDFATAMQIDLGTAARLAGQAATGMTGTLSRYGVVLSDTVKEEVLHADAMERAEIMARELAKRFGGAAAADLETYAGRVAQLGNYWGDFKEALGDVIVKAQAAPGVLEKVKDALEGLVGYAQDFGETIVFIANYDFGAAVNAQVRLTAVGWLKLFAAIHRGLADLPEWMGGGAENLQIAKIEEASADMLDHFARIELDRIFEDASNAALDFRDAVSNVTLAVNGGGAGGADTLTGGLEQVGEVAKESFLSAGDQFIDILGPDGRVHRMGWDTAFKGKFEEMPEWAKDSAVESGEKMTTEFAKTSNIMESTFSDLLGKGFIGELDSFSDMWDQIWQDLAKSMTGILGDAFEDAMKDGGTIGGVVVRFWDNFKTKIKENPLGSALAGAGGLYSAYQQGGTGGILQGIMSGAMSGGGFGALLAPGSLGTSIPIGAAIGAAAGLLAGIFGGKDSPESAGSIGIWGGSVTRTQGQGLPDRQAAWTQFSTERVQEYRTAIREMNDVLRLFSDGGLFDLVGEAPEWNFSGAGTLDSFAAVFREQWLPEAMRQMFEGAINQGLGNFGVSDETVAQLWGELEGLTGSNRIAGLETFVSSLVGAVDLMADMDWNTIQDESRMDSFAAFMSGMGSVVDAVQMQMLGIGDMTLLERAEQAQSIEQLIVQARQAEIQMLRQIDMMQQSINRSIDQQIEGIRTGGMGGTQQRTYYENQIAQIMTRLRGGVGSPEELQTLMADLQRYVGLMQGALGDSLYESIAPWGGNTWADHLIGILEEARGLSDEAFTEMRDQIQATNEALIAELQLLISALTDFTGALTGGADGKSLTPEVTIPVEVNVNIEGDKSLFVREVRSIIHAELNRKSSMPGLSAPHGVM